MVNYYLSHQNQTNEVHVDVKSIEDNFLLDFSIFSYIYLCFLEMKLKRIANVTMKITHVFVGLYAEINICLNHANQFYAQTIHQLLQYNYVYKQFYFGRKTASM